MSKRIVITHPTGLRSIQGTLDQLVPEGAPVPVELVLPTGFRYNLIGVYPRYVSYKESYYDSETKA